MASLIGHGMLQCRHAGSHNVGVQCAAAAALQTSSGLAVVTEAACKPPSVKRKTDASTRAPPSIVSTIKAGQARPKARLKRRLLVGKVESLLAALFAGGGDGSFSGGSGDDHNGGSGGDDGPFDSFGESEEGWGNDGASDLAGLTAGRYIDTTWMWHLACVFCLANTGAHIAVGAQTDTVCT